MSNFGQGSRTAVRLAEKLAALAVVVRSLKPVYDSGAGDKELRRLIETLLGAAIWYLPQPRELWTGKISVNALASLPDGKLSRDHNIPRKIAGARLLQLSLDQLSQESLMLMYQQNLGTFNLVTKQENRKLMPFQRAEVYQTTEAAYLRAGIELVSAQDNPLVVSALFGKAGMKSKTAPMQ